MINLLKNWYLEREFVISSQVSAGAALQALANSCGAQAVNIRSSSSIVRSIIKPTISGYVYSNRVHLVARGKPVGGVVLDAEVLPRPYGCDIVGELRGRPEFRVISAALLFSILCLFYAFGITLFILLSDPSRDAAVGVLVCALLFGLSRRLYLDTNRSMELAAPSLVEWVSTRVRPSWSRALQ